MKRSRVAKRYAQAIFESALEHEQLETIESELDMLVEHYRSVEEFRTLIESPVVANQAKQSVIAHLYKDKLSERTFRFLNLLIAKNREGELLRVVDELGVLLDRHRGIVRGEVHSVVPLTEPQLSQLVTRLNRMTGRKVVVSRHTNPELLGGVVVKIEDRVYDTSLRNQLRKLRETLAGS